MAAAAVDNSVRLGALLVEHGVVAPAEVESALVRQTQSGGRLGEILLERQLLSRPLLERILARQAGVVLEEEDGFGTGLRALIEYRHLQRSGRSSGYVDAGGPLRDAVGLLRGVSPGDRRSCDRRAGRDRRGAGR